MIKEFEVVLLTQPLAEDGRRAGDIGWVVRIGPDGATYDVEFVTPTGDSAGIATVPAACLQRIGPESD